MKKQEPNKGFWADFKRFFFRGLAAILPSLLTLWLIIWGYQFINDYFGYYVNKGTIWIVAHLQTMIYGGSAEERLARLSEFWRSWRLDIGGFIIAMVLIYFLGIFLASFVGRWIWRLIEVLLGRTPLIGQVYPQVKQVTDFFLTKKHLSALQVVAVEYPRKGIWSLGVITGEAPKELSDHTGTEVVSVFVASSPTPMTGYAICVPKNELLYLSVSMDDFLKFVISGGVLGSGSKLLQDPAVPPAELPKPQEPQQQTGP